MALRNVTSVSLVVLLVATGALVAAADASGPESFRVREDRSAVRIHVGKSGVLSFAGHLHEITAPVDGTIVANAADVGASTVELVFPTSRFEVDPASEPEGDAPKVQEVMRGPRVLEAARFPDVHFRSTRIAGRSVGADGGRAAGRFQLEVTGEVTIHGVTRELTLPMDVVLEGDSLRARGHAAIRHDQFGLTPVTAGGGSVRVRNEIEIDFDIVAARTH